MTFTAPVSLAVAVALCAGAFLLRCIVPRTAQPRATLRGVVRTAGSWRQRLERGANGLRWTALLVLALALGRPRAPAREVVEEFRGRDVALILDHSSSMTLRDRAGATTRFDAAREVLSEFVERRSEDRLALIGFARFAEVLCPGTRDASAIASSLMRATPAEPRSPLDGTALGPALATAAELLSAEARSARIAVLLTDGENNYTEITPGEGVALCQSAGVRVHTIGFGASFATRSATGGRRVLAQIAEATGGRSFIASDREQLSRIYAAIDRSERGYLEHRRLEPGREWWRVLAWGGLVAWTLAAAVAARWCPRAGSSVSARLQWGGLGMLAAALFFTHSDVDSSDLEPARLMVVLDVSRSMRADDLAPDRLAAGLAELERFLADARGVEIGLVAFSGRAFDVMPPTRDAAAVLDAARALDPDLVEPGGFALESAVALASRWCGEFEREAVVVLSDGEDPRGDGALAPAASRVPVFTRVCGTAGGAAVTRAASAGRQPVSTSDGEPAWTSARAERLGQLAADCGGAPLDAKFSALGRFLGARERAPSHQWWCWAAFCMLAFERVLRGGWRRDR